MTATLTLFPSRIRFTNADGTLTPEAYRALQTLVERSGGIMGDNGVDVFGELTGAGTQDSSFTDTVTQASEAEQVPEMVAQQPLSVDVIAPDVVQQAEAEPFMPDVVQPTAIGINTDITSALLTGKTITVQNGLITGFN